jgi:hypothetical protein
VSLVTRAVLSLLICLAFAAPALAQQQEPLPIFVADVRGIFARHKVEPDIAKGLDVANANLPTRSFGLVAGAHVYPLRGRKISIGTGATLLIGGGGRALDTTASDGTVTTGPRVRRHFISIVPEISLNFGHRNGWSYISGGFFGRSKLYLDREDAPATGAPLRSTFTYGGGARWFTNDHVAFSVDFHWYSVAEELPSATTTAVFQPRTTLLVLSAGISLK